MEQTLWVFGYGSLIWNPGFEHEQAVIARLSGFKRSFCMHSVHHRGTVQHPGLVLALDEDPGAGCDGLAFRVPPGARARALKYLRERELVSSAYVERMRPVMLCDGRLVQGLVYLVDRTHGQYARDLSLEKQAQIIAGARGDRGTNAEYLHKTAAHLKKLNLRDADLEWLTKRVRALEKV